jgi:hypothetical protein
VRYILLLPFFIALFILDRAFLVLVYWKSVPKFEDWVYKDELILDSIHRVCVGLLVLLVVEYSISIF